MTSPCGFKTKHCQERSALAKQPAPCSAVLRTRRAIQSSKSKTKPIIILVLFSCPYRLLHILLCASPIWVAATNLPARLERGPQHPGDFSPFTLPTVGEAVWWARDEGEGGKRRRRRIQRWGGQEKQNKKKVCVCVHMCENRRIEVAWGVHSERSAEVLRSANREAFLMHVQYTTESSDILILIKLNIDKYLFWIRPEV